MRIFYAVWRFWVAFLLGINYWHQPELRIRRMRNLGIGMGIAYRPLFSQVWRYEKHLLSGLIGILALAALALYLAISPDSLLDLRYILAFVYMLYTTCTVIMVYQWVRDAKGPDVEDYPDIEEDICAICLEFDPVDDLIDLQCGIGNENRVPNENEEHLHRFHEYCLADGWDHAAGQQALCPICRRIPVNYHRTYHVLDANFLDQSRLLWYISSLFWRLGPLLGNWEKLERRRRDDAAPMANRDRHHRIVLFRVLPLHCLAVTLLVLFVNYVYRLSILPLSWPVWLIVVWPVTYAIIYNGPEAAAEIYEQTYQLLPRIGVMNFVNWWFSWIDRNMWVAFSPLGFLRHQYTIGYHLLAELWGRFLKPTSKRMGWQLLKHAIISVLIVVLYHLYCIFDQNLVPY